MNALQIIEYATRNGLTITPANGKLKISGNREAANDAFLTDLATHKAELLALLPGGSVCADVTPTYGADGLLEPASIVALADEADRLIDAWCRAFRAAEDTRQRMLAARKRMAPMALPGEIELMKAELAEITKITIRQ